ncbi:hypothetical protein [Allosphingosinicella vermicomposti]|uniref:hypothetical protein n=1 Tax=Allosphingosinicella vermicomposti TaxID=614671 RepID=UPI000D107E71|nr:hypothetical protein [Allosphingosinicella vermicomposti]
MGIIWTLITPAFIASVLSIAINIRADKFRARREYITASFEAVRATIDTAVKAAAEYFPLPAVARTPAIEAKLWLADRELRFALSPLIKNASSGLDAELEQLTAAFDDLIALLTGGSFQSSKAEADLKHLRLIASAGAELRAKLTDVRHAELRQAVEQDILSRFIHYWTEPTIPRGIR